MSAHTIKKWAALKSAALACNGWRWPHRMRDKYGTHHFGVRNEDGDFNEIGTIDASTYTGEYADDIRVLKFIRAAQPETVVSLVDELESARARVAELEAEAFKLAAMTCVHPAGTQGNESGYACCPITGTNDAQAEQPAQGDITGDQVVAALHEFEELRLKCHEQQSTELRDILASKIKYKTVAVTDDEAKEALANWRPMLVAVPAEQIEREKLLRIIGYAYQVAGALDADERILDVLSDPEAATDQQIEAMLPYVPPEQPAAAGGQEAVAWLKEWDSVGGAQKGMRRVDLSPDCETWLQNMFPRLTPLYRAAPSIPDGYVVVPKEPTAEMTAAAMKSAVFDPTRAAFFIKGLIANYRKMIAAAPPVPEQRK